MTLWSTQPLTEKSTRDVFLGIGGRCLGLTTVPPSCAECLEVLGVITSRSPKGLSRSVQGLFLLYAQLILGLKMQFLLQPPDQNLYGIHVTVWRATYFTFTYRVLLGLSLVYVYSFHKKRISISRGVHNFQCDNFVEIAGTRHVAC